MLIQNHDLTYHSRYIKVMELHLSEVASYESHMLAKLSFCHFILKYEDVSILNHPLHFKHKEHDNDRTGLIHFILKLWV